MMMNLRTTHVMLLCVLGGLGGCLQPDGSASDASTDAASSSTGADSTSSTGDGSSTSDPTTGTGTGTSSSTTSTGACGDGVVDELEECDDAAGNADDAACTAACLRNVCGDGKLWSGHEDCDDGAANADGGACTSACTLARCGDGKVQDGVEFCDDGVNDGSYGSCAVDCSAQAAHCGDGIVDPMEECDSGGASCLGNCMFATSCLRVHEAEPDLPSGLRTIYPVSPAQGVEVYCDMVSDGGGYTFLKIDVDSDLNDLPYPAKKAEATCAEYGMHLFIPRSADHLIAAHGVATTDNLAPKGGGIKALGPDYLQILGIYPLKAGISCVGKPLVPANCPQWVAADGGPWYVSKVVANASEPDPADACLGCSMIYTWNADASIKSYKTLPAPGGSSLRFMCDVGDKRP
jgi:hypothetical protein